MNTKVRIANLEGQLKDGVLFQQAELKHIEGMIEHAKSLVESLEERKEQLQKSIQSINETLKSIGVDRQQWRIRYWTGLRDFMTDNGSSLKCRTPRDSSDFRFSIGRTYFTVYACLASSEREINIRLYMAGDFAKVHYHLLKEQQSEIHNEFGETLEWHERPENTRSQISLSRANTDPLDENDWPHQYEWFTTQLEVFDTVFRERIRGLNAADWIPEEDDP